MQHDDCAANLFQVMFNRLYACGSSTDGGTLLQLRNLINRRNVSQNTNGKFNESIDFFELVVKCYVAAAGMHFFGMGNKEDMPTKNAFPTDITKCTAQEQWTHLRTAVNRIVDR